MAVEPGPRLLDLGCGDGTLTKKLVERGLRVVGVDASAAQVEAACKLGLDARVMGGQALSFEGEFDAVFSNATLHWLHRPERMAAGVARALVSGGQFVAEFGGVGNVEHIKRALLRGLDRRGLCRREHLPWLFPTLEHYRGVLEGAGFSVAAIELFERPTPLPGDITTWVDLFAPELPDGPPGSRPT